MKRENQPSARPRRVRSDAKRPLARIVASFYWQLTGTINQDIPLDAEGTPTEFDRYVGYFLDRRPEFQLDLAVPLRQMVLAIYLDAIEAGVEPRKAVRRASRDASALARRTRGLRDQGFDRVPLRGHDPFTILDLIEARLLRHGEALVGHMFGNQRVPTALLREAERVSALGLAPPADHGWGRWRDCARGFCDCIGEWVKLLRGSSAAAFKVLMREVMAAPRLVPSSMFLIGSVALYLYLVADGISRMQGATDALIVVAALVASIWMSDALTYLVHLDRDGWGDSPETRAFQDHHDFPDEVALWTVRRSVGTVGHGILILMMVLVWWQPSPAIGIGAGTALVAFLFATQCHRWAHTPKHLIPRWIRILQRIRLILPVDEHAKHHHQLNRSWGIFNGWSNGLLDRIVYHEIHTRVRAWLFGQQRPLWESQREARRAGGWQLD